MASVRTSTGVCQHISSGLAQTEEIIEFAAGKQTAIRRDLRSVELQLEATVKRQPKSSVLRFTRRRFRSAHLSSPYPVGGLTRIDAYGQCRTQAMAMCRMASAEPRSR